MLWDIGLPAATKASPMEQGNMTASIDRTVVDQLAGSASSRADSRVVGISHCSGDRTGQARDFPRRGCVIGKEDFEQTAGKDDPFTRSARRRQAGDRARIRDIDVFGDGDVVTLFMPGRTPGHRALLVKLKSRRRAADRRSTITR